MATDDDYEVLEARSVAFLYDLHGNLAALKAVIEDLSARDVDLVVFGGDYALKGPEPGRTIDVVRDMDMPAIRGNTDEYLVSDAPRHREDPVVAWTRGTLDDAQLDWLAERPFGVRVAPPGQRGDPACQILAVHATPTDIEAVLLLEAHPFEAWDVLDRDQASAMLGEVEADAVVYGHIHCPLAGTVDGQRIRSFGSVGFPWDGDRRAAYGLGRWNGDGWVFQDIRVDYDWGAVADALEASETPRAAQRAASIRDASFAPLADGEDED